MGQGAASAEQSRVAATLANWKRKLLDVSKRNRALNFRPTKVSTITIVEEQPAEVFRQLYLQDRQMRFRPAPAEPEPTLFAEAPALTQGQPEEPEEFGPAQDFIPYDSTSLGDQHTDDLLQTSAKAEELDKSLRRISD
jgi:hypothetical protein